MIRAYPITGSFLNLKQKVNEPEIHHSNMVIIHFPNRSSALWKLSCATAVQLLFQANSELSAAL